jgi:hypothetical protein
MNSVPIRTLLRAVVPAVVLALSLCQASVFAQGTPAAADPNVPAPDECQIALPETIEFPADSMRPVAATPRPIITEAETPFAPPAGEPADEETVAAITATVRESIACRNAGDFARMLVFFTPTMLAELYGSPATVDPEVLQGIQEGPRALPEPRRLRLDAIESIVMVPDGRVGAVVETSTPRREFRDYLFFVLDAESGRWLIDGSVPLAE